MNCVLNKFGLLALTGVAATLVACGGNDDTYLDLKGVAATGLAISGGAVTVQCVSGTGTATTSATGSYAVTVVNGEGPCLVTVKKDGLTLRSIAAKTTTGTAVANVTQFSDAIVTGLIASKGVATAEALFTNAASTPTNDQLKSAVTAVIATINEALRTAGKTELSLTTDLLGKADFVAATPTTPSTDPLDKALDELVLPNTTVLAPSLITSISNKVTTVVPKGTTGTPTGATGGTGASGG